MLWNHFSIAFHNWHYSGHPDPEEGFGDDDNIGRLMTLHSAECVIGVWVKLSLWPSCHSFPFKSNSFGMLPLIWYVIHVTLWLCNFVWLCDFVNQFPKQVFEYFPPLCYKCWLYWNSDLITVYQNTHQGTNILLAKHLAVSIAMFQLFLEYDSSVSLLCSIGYFSRRYTRTMCLTHTCIPHCEIVRW